MKAATIRRHRKPSDRLVYLLIGLTVAFNLPLAAADQMRDEVPPLLRQYCVDCHGGDLVEAQVDLDRITSQPDFGRHFKDWERVVRMLQSGKMPPEDMPQPEEVACLKDLYHLL